MALFGGPSQPETRLEELKRLLQRDPMSRQFLALAEEYRRHGKYRDAVITLERGLALHANSVAGHVALGKAYQQLDRLEDAIRAFTNALRIDRENLVAIRQLAEVYLARGEKVEAIKKLKLYRGLKAGDRDVNEIIARLEQEMSVAVAERPGFRSGVRPVVVAPPGFLPPPGPPSSAANRRAALLRRLDVPATEPAPPPGPPGARPPDPMALTYGGASVARALGKVEPLDAPPPPAAEPEDDLFLETTPVPSVPAAPPADVPTVTLPIQQIRDEIEAAAFAPPTRPAPEPMTPSGPQADLDDVPTAPFQFPANLYRVGVAPVPTPSRPVPETPIVTETLAAIYESQGFSADARETYRTLAESEADDARARALREKAAALPAAERADRPHLRRLARRFPKRKEATPNDLHAMIRALVDSTEGIRAATLADSGGLPVVTAGPVAREPGQEILVAELTAFLKSVDRAAGEVGAGALRAVTFAGAHGTAVVSRVNDDYSLILHVDPDAILGEVRWEAERTARALSPAVR
jgi:predicted regulator of Ras-like GTPase activity (Roadblock/LC7/MglB family)/Tfp pilus assembly protein PilF